MTAKALKHLFTTVHPSLHWTELRVTGIEVMQLLSEYLGWSTWGPWNRSELQVTPCAPWVYHLGLVCRRLGWSGKKSPRARMVLCKEPCGPCTQTPYSALSHLWAWVHQVNTPPCGYALAPRLHSSAAANHHCFVVHLQLRYASKPLLPPVGHRLPLGSQGQQATEHHYPGARPSLACPDYKQILFFQ